MIFAAFYTRRPGVRHVAWNLATNRLRHLRVAVRHLARQREEHVDGPTPDRIALQRALAQLPPKHPLAIVLHHFGGLSTSEIAVSFISDDGRVLGGNARLQSNGGALAIGWSCS